MTGVLSIQTSPVSARIYIDNIDTLKITPTELILDAGNHNYKLELSGYQSVIGSINVTDNTITYLVVPLLLDYTTKLVTLAYISVGATIGLGILNFLSKRR